MSEIKRDIGFGEDPYEGMDRAEYYREMKEYYEELASVFQCERFWAEGWAHVVVSNYLESIGIKFGNARGPYYLDNCYTYYALDGIESGEEIIAKEADNQGLRPSYIRLALDYLMKKIAVRDPNTAQWAEQGYDGWLKNMFRYMEEKEPQYAADARNFVVPEYYRKM